MNERANRSDILNLPNILTAIRILLAPAILAVFFNEPKEKRVFSLCLFLAAGLTDCMDGFFARRMNRITKLGMILDPIADKLLTATMLFCLVWSKTVNVAVLIVIVVKELYMAVGASICLRKKIEVCADIFGKTATVLFYPAVMLCWPWHGVKTLTTIGQVLIYISAALSIIAAIHYTLSSLQKYHEMKNNAQ